MTGIQEVRRSLGVSLLLMAVLFLSPMGSIRYTIPAASEPLPEVMSGTAGDLDGTASQPEDVVSQDEHTILRVLEGESVVERNLSAYLMGVVRAEMPASFQPEALKAQAVAARTYTLYQLQNGGKHGETADICTDSACCQAYLEEGAARENWGIDADLYSKKIQSAVEETDGQVILYDGEPILAAFHASSSGLTRKADTVWRSDVPYLQPVASPENADAIPNYYSRAEFSGAEFREHIHSVYPQADLSGSVEDWMGSPVTDEGGNVISVNVGGVTLRGSQLRSLLGLRSACFTWETDGDRLVFYVTGNGHGIGLSQYGANQMALDGAAYTEILTHYYTNVTVARFSKMA